VLFCFKLGNSVAKTKKMLKQAFGDDASSQTQTYSWFNSLKMAEYQLMMTNVLNDLQLAQHRIMLQKCVRVSVRITGEQSVMSATLRDCHMGHASKFGQTQHEADCCKIRAKAAENNQKQHQLEISMELKEQVSNDPHLLFKVVTGNESWIYGYDTEAK
jgi:hypothetical protein